MPSKEEFTKKYDQATYEDLMRTVGHSSST